VVTAETRARLEQLEEAGFEPGSIDLLVVLAWLAKGQVEVSENELNAARRRAMFVLAAGGDPHRELDVESVAAERLAGELDTPGRRTQLAGALLQLAEAADGLPAVLAGLEALRGDGELAWRCFALALLADEVAGE
jgi:hypothetical protein